MESLQNSFENFLATTGSYLPGVLGALVILIIGWLVASGLRKLTYRLLNRTNLDERLLGRNPSGNFSSEKLISKLVYFIIMVIVLMIVLEKLGVTQVLDPVKDMVGKFLSFIPNILAAGLIAFVGYMIANIVSELVGAAGTTIRSLVARTGLSTEIDIVGILKRLVFILIFVPVLIAALDALEVRAISEPAQEMLGTFIDAIPKIFAAGLIIGVFYVGARFIRSLAKELLHSAGADSLATRMGLGDMIGEGQSLSGLIANLAFFFILFLGVITGVEKLDFAALTITLQSIFAMTGKIVLGLVILTVGNWLSIKAKNMVAKGDNSVFLASLTRFSILALFIPMALSTMDVADNIVNLAFGLTLGAIAVAFALSFGLGGREAAGKTMEDILSRFRK